MLQWQSTMVWSNCTCPIPHLAEGKPYRSTSPPICIRSKGVREIEVPSVSVDSLVKRFHDERLRLLQVDTEGMDYQILKWFFDAHVEPDVLNFESLHLSKVERMVSRQLLNSRGYWWIESDQDTFALKECLVKSNTVEARN
jgi:hypothetical protein